MYDDSLVILSIEDDENDRLFIRRALKRLGGNIKSVFAEDGEAAIVHLRSQSGSNEQPAPLIPDLIITDLKMPKMGGLDFLVWLQQQSEYAHIPTLVLTSSSDAADINKAFELGAKGYMIKPVHYSELEKLFQTVTDYWSRSRRPEARRPGRDLF